MKWIIFLFILTGFELFALEWEKKSESLALLQGKSVIWRHVHSDKEAKPFFHPLSTPEGFVLSGLKPSDHPWHRGLWFSWKYINGVNFWEENRNTGKSNGTTKIVEIKVTPKDDFSAEIELKIHYFVDPAKVLLEEVRTLKITPPEDGKYTINWISKFTSLEDVFLDRTPLPKEKGGKPYGGYAGLSFRAARELRSKNNWRFVGSENQALIHGQKSTALSFKGSDGFIKIIPLKPHFNHSWYIAPGMPYFSPALLFEKGMELKKSAELNLAYKIEIGSSEKEKILK